MPQGITHGTLGQLYRLTCLHVVDGTPYELYAAAVEGSAAMPLSEVAWAVEDRIRERGILVEIRDLTAEVLILDLQAAAALVERTEET